MTVRNGKTAAETDRSRGEARQRDFITAHSSIMAGFYEQRVTCHKIRVCTSFAAGRPLAVPYGIAVRRWERKRGHRLQKKYMASGHVRRGRPLTSQTAFGGQLPYKGSLVRPAAIFGHSRSEYNGKFLRATNNEPRFFPQGEGHSRRCRHSESVAAKRHLSPRRHANCQL